MPIARLARPFSWAFSGWPLLRSSSRGRRATPGRRIPVAERGRTNGYGCRANGACLRPTNRQSASGRAVRDAEPRGVRDAPSERRRITAAEHRAGDVWRDVQGQGRRHPIGNRGQVRHDGPRPGRPERDHGSLATQGRSGPQASLAATGVGPSALAAPAERGDEPTGLDLRDPGAAPGTRLAALVVDRQEVADLLLEGRWDTLLQDLDRDARASRA